MTRNLSWFCAAALVLALACSAPRSVLQPDIDVAKARAQARELLADAATRAEGHRQLGWLCLLHGDGCAQLPEHGRQAARLGAEGALLAALALHGQSSVASRAEAWLAVLDAGLTLLQPLPTAPAEPDRADALMTLGAEALARLAVRDRQAVIAQLQARPQPAGQALRQGTPEQRWRRMQALGPLLAALAPQGALDMAGPPLRTATELTLVVQPVSRRLYTGLLAQGAQAPMAADLAASASRTDQELVRLPLDAGQSLLPADLRTGRYHLPAVDPGVYALRAEFPAGKSGRALVLLRAPRGVRLWSAGRLRIDASAGRGQGRLLRAWIDVLPGQNRLDLLVSVAGGGEALDLDVLQADGAAELTADAQATPAWPEALRDVTQALLAPESPARARLARLFDRGPIAALAAVEDAASLDPQHTAPAAVLDRLLEALPGHLDAQVDRVAKVREAGNPALALQMLRQMGGLEAMPPALLTSGETRAPAQVTRADLLLGRARLLQALNLGDEAAQAARTAVQMQPGDCQVFEQAVVLAMDGMHRPLLRQLLAQPPRCPDRALPVATAQAMIGDVAAARATLELAMQQPAQAREAWQRLQIMADADGRPAPAAPPWQQDATGLAWRAAQRAELDHDHAKAHAALARLLTGPGHSLEARQKALQAGAPVPWTAFVHQGEAVAAEPDDPQLVQGATTAWLLDQEIVLLLPGGGAVRRIHQIVRVLKDEAAESVGEVRVADGAELEFARTLLPDGSTVLPAETADKDTISLRAVESGTAVEFAQIAYVPPSDPATGATRLPTFVLGATDAPTVRTEYIVLVAKDMQVRFETSPSTPSAELRQVGDYTAHIWRRTAVPRFRAEARSVRAELALPSVRVTARADMAALLGPWQESLAAWLDLRDEDLDRWVEVVGKLAPGRPRWQGLAMRIAAAVQQTHEGGAPGRPDVALQNQKGDRASLFYTLARRLGGEACLVRVLPLAKLPGRNPPDPDDWGLELVRLRMPGPGGGELWYDPGLEGGLLDHVRSGIRGREGLLVGCPQPPADPHVQVPRLGDGLDQRVIAVDLAWQADGSLQGTVRDAVSGTLAAVVRSWLTGANEATRAEILRQLTGTAFAGLSLTWQDIDGLEGTPGARLMLTYAVTGTADAARSRALDLGLFADQLGQAYAGLAQRHTQLLFSSSLDVQLDIAVRSPGRPVTTLPPEVTVTHPLVQYHRTAQLTGGVLHVHKDVRARPAVVAPAEYEALARRLRELDAADTVRLER